MSEGLQIQNVLASTLFLQEVWGMGLAFEDSNAPVPVVPPPPPAAALPAPEPIRDVAGFVDGDDCAICVQTMNTLNSIVVCRGRNNNSEHRFHPRCIEIWCRNKCHRAALNVYRLDARGFYARDAHGNHILSHRVVSRPPLCPLCNNPLTAPDNPPGTHVQWSVDPPRHGYYYPEPISTNFDREGHPIYILGKLAVEENHQPILTNNDILEEFDTLSMQTTLTECDQSPDQPLLSEPRLIFGL